MLDIGCIRPVLAARGPGGRGPRLTRRLAPFLTAALVLAALGCREDATSPTTPEPQPALATTAAALSFRQISPGVNHSCGVTTDNRAYCWGNNTLNRPVAAAVNLQFLEVRAGSSYTCGLTNGQPHLLLGVEHEGPARQRNEQRL